MRFVCVDGKIGENVFLSETKTDCLIVSNRVRTVDETNRFPITILNTGDLNIVCRVNKFQGHQVKEETIPEKNESRQRSAYE